MVFPVSDGISRVPPYSGSWEGKRSCHIQGCHLLWRSFPTSFVNRSCPMFQSYNPNMQACWFGLFPVRSPLLRESHLLSIPTATEMFQFTAFTLNEAMYSLRLSYSIKNKGFPHSEISGSLLTYSSPEHIGVRPVLLRLLVPRHPPCALIHLTCRLKVLL